MTWIDVIKEQLAKMRKEGKSPSIGDVTPAAKKEWEEIKSGKHPRYSQGSSQGRKGKGSMSKGKGMRKGKSSKGKSSKGKSSKGKSSKGNKTQKNTNPSGSMDHTYCIEQMLKKVRLCKKDVAHIHKYLKTLKIQKGGDCGCSQSGGSCDSCQAGGKKKGKKQTKKKGMRGGSTNADADASTSKESYVSITDKKTGEYDGSEETDGTEEAVTRDEE